MHEGSLGSFEKHPGRDELAEFLRAAAALDRPLVSTLLQNFVTAAGNREEEDENKVQKKDTDAFFLQRLLDTIAQQLWAEKWQAWITDPFPQLMQLVKVEQDVMSAEQVDDHRRAAHQIVGHHFGRV
jgi:hypothetical protein